MSFHGFYKNVINEEEVTKDDKLNALRKLTTLTRIPQLWYIL